MWFDAANAGCVKYATETTYHRNAPRKRKRMELPFKVGPYYPLEVGVATALIEVIAPVTHLEDHF